MPEGAIYERQRHIEGLNVPQKATIVGCGGTGFWTALLLAMSGTEELILIDADNIEESNLNRLPIDRSSIGRSKVNELKDLISRLRPDTRIETHKFKIHGVTDCEILRGKVFCCTDNLQSQQLICAYCKKNDLSYQRVGYDGTILNVSKGFPLSFEDKPVNGYQVTPSWVAPAVLAGALAVVSQSYKELMIMDDISKINISGSSYVPGGIRDVLIEEGIEKVRDNVSDYCEGYGYCYECDHVPDGYSYCGDCGHDGFVSEDEAEDMKKASYDEGYEAGLIAGIEEAKKEGV